MNVFCCNAFPPGEHGRAPDFTFASGFFCVILSSVRVALWSQGDQDLPDEAQPLKGMYQNGGFSPPSPAQHTDKERCWKEEEEMKQPMVCTC